MLTKIYLLSILVSFFSFEKNKSSNDSNEETIKVIGRAIVLKHDAAIMTDDSVRYYLNGIDHWSKKYLGKRVEVTGKLVIKKYEVEKSTNPAITVTPQQRLGTWRIIESPKWRLVN